MITLKPRQIEAQNIITDPRVRQVLLFGGPGAGKTFIALDTLLERANHAPGSRHLCLRSTNIDAKAILFEGTFKDVLNRKYEVNHGEGITTWDFLREKGKITLDPMRYQLDNGSEIIFRGLDDNRLDRVLGADYSSIFISEVSLIDDYTVISTLGTRLRQRVTTVNGRNLGMKFIFDCNPPSERHWTFPVFAERVNYNTRLPHTNPEQYQCLQMRTEDNLDNLADGYFEGIMADSEGDYVSRQRYVKGWWYKDVQNPMFHSKDIAAARRPARKPEECDDLRIIVAIDPAITAKKGSDETGIIVLGVNAEDHAFVLEDLSGVYQPSQWGEEAVDAYHRWNANQIVAEKNQGGDMVESNLRAVDPRIPVKLIHASKSKEIRAEGAATAYKQHRVHHCGPFPKLEDQLVEFETGFNRRKKGYSPDRLDALVHGLNELLISERERWGVSQHRVKSFWS